MNCRPAGPTAQNDRGKPASAAAAADPLDYLVSMAPRYKTLRERERARHTERARERCATRRSEGGCATRRTHLSLQAAAGYGFGTRTEHTRFPALGALNRESTETIKTLCRRSAVVGQHCVRRGGSVVMLNLEDKGDRGQLYVCRCGKGECGRSPRRTSGNRQRFNERFRVQNQVNPEDAQNS